MISHLLAARFSFLYPAALLTCLLLGCNPSSDKSLQIAVASNARFAISDIAELYEEQYDQQVDIITSSSGKLTAQLMNGAPYDLFLSADLTYPKKLYEEGKTINEPEVYALGYLAIWTNHQDMLLSLESLTSSAIHKIAIANPDIAPYGKATLETLQNAGIYEELKSKFIFGESISQVSQFLFSRAADAGFIVPSIAMQNQLKDNGQWVKVDESLYAPIQQGVVKIKLKERHTHTDQFYQFLFGPSAAAIFKKHGYRVD